MAILRSVISIAYVTDKQSHEANEFRFEYKQ